MPPEAVPQTPAAETTPPPSEPTSAGITTDIDTDAPAGADDGAGSSDFDFTNFDKEFDAVDSSETDEPAAPAPSSKAPEPEKKPDAKATSPAAKKPDAVPAPAAPAEKQPLVAEKKEAAPAEPPKAEGKEPATPPAQPQDTPPAGQPLTAEQHREQYQKWRTESEAKLMELYSLAPEDAEKMLSEPEKVLPKVLAKHHLDVFEAVTTEFYQRLPQIVGSIIQQAEATKQHENDFFTAFPKLKPHAQKVAQFARAYRQVNPQMPREEFMQHVGTAMMMALKIPFEEPPQTPDPNAAGTAPGEPERTVVARDVMHPGGGFTPAPTAGVAPGSGKQPQKNIFEQFAEDLLADDS